MVKMPILNSSVYNTSHRQYKKKILLCLTKKFLLQVQYFVPFRTLRPLSARGSLLILHNVQCDSKILSHLPRPVQPRSTTYLQCHNHYRDNYGDKCDPAQRSHSFCFCLTYLLLSARTFHYFTPKLSKGYKFLFYCPKKKNDFSLPSLFSLIFTYIYITYFYFYFIFNYNFHQQKILNILLFNIN